MGRRVTTWTGTISWRRGSVFLGAESPLGPVYLAAGLSEGGAAGFYLLLGRTF